MAQGPLKPGPAPVTSSNLRIKKIAVNTDSVLLDTTSIIPSSFKITGVDTSAYALDFIKAVLHWKTKPASDSVIILYRAFPYRFNAVAQHLSYDSILKKSYLAPYVFVNDNAETANLFDFGNIQYNGSFGRAISFGNSPQSPCNPHFGGKGARRG